MKPIQIVLSSNEKGTNRAEGIEWAASNDTRFAKPVYSSEGLVDVQFIGRPCDNIFQAELKKVEDYLTVLNKEGHPRNQYLDMAEQGHPSMFVVLGGDQQISAALKKDLYSRGFRGTELDFKLEESEDRLRDFEAQCFALKCPVMRWQVNPYKRLLSTAHKVLTGGSLMGYGPRPQENEREVVAANCLFRNIGPETLATVLKHYKVSLTPRHPNPIPVCDLPGVGPKRAALLEERIVEVYGGMI